MEAAPRAALEKHGDHAGPMCRQHIIVEAIADLAARGKNCKLRLIKTLKGSEVNDGLDVQCRIPSQGDWMTDFSSHSEDLFWKQRSGRVGISSACTPIAPAFEIGKKILAGTWRSARYKAI